ncbi:zinc ribbon domain-containing protein [Methanobrevibacter sp.]|uniref:zinc ribbon domain-containing protein n=1 Tax=Methanobrevibacter sp. TaxID=66852 RepID=UPI00388E12B1
MEKYCRNCGVKLKESDVFCSNCGSKVITPNRNFLEKYKIPLIIIAIIAIVAISFLILTPQTQIVTVDNVQFEIPADYVNEPSRTEVSYDENVKSSAMGWSNDDTYIEIGVSRTPGEGIDSQEVASRVGGSPTKMLGYSGYYQKYDDESYSFVFGMKDKVCMVYVSDYDAFDDVKVIGDV